MRLFLLLASNLLFIGGGFAQKPVFENYVPPVYPGGTKAFSEYVRKFIRYPAIALENDIEGIVQAYIKIDSVGNVVDVKAASEEFFFKEAVIPKLKLMPKWTTATMNGNPIDTIVSKLIYFSLGKSRTGNDTAKAEVLVVKFISQGRGFIFYPDSASQPITDATINKRNENKKKSTELYNAGVKLLQEENYSEAIKKFNEAEILTSGQSDLLYNRGIAFYKLNEFDKACADWLEAYRYGDKDAEGLYKSKCGK